MSVRVLSAILDALAACARIVFEVGLALPQWVLERAKEARREREARGRDDRRRK
jgi:hypothetical protein